MRQTIAAVFTLCLGLAADVIASDEVVPPAPIQITSGGINASGPGGFTIAGTNFSFTQTSVPIDPPDRLCRRGCLGGSVVDIGLGASDFANGTAVHDGVTYITGPGPVGSSLVVGGFRGTIVLPPVSAGTIGIQVQLTFAAEFWPLGDRSRAVLLIGSGTGTIVFTAVFPPPESSDGPRWVFNGLQYRINPPGCTSQVINDGVSVSVNSTSFDPRPVPLGPAGTFVIDATLANTSPQVAEGPVKLVVRTLAGNNRLLSATEGDGGVWSKQIVAQTLAPGATVQHVSLAVGLATRNPFVFLVDVEACASGDGD